MAFLNNSGDIILDAVLTDLGRKRLSQGDGSFEISQFALGDDEIDYSQYNISTGSAYQDLDILQTPILEAITDNIASMKSKLVTYSNTSLLYLPIEKLETSDANGAGFATSSIGTYVALVNADGDFGTNTGTIYGFSSRSPAKNLLPGNFLARSTGDRTKNSITIHQGLNTTQVSFTENLANDLTETDYFVYLDNRLGTLVKPNGDTLQPAFIDDDNIATYVISQGNAVNAENFVTIRDPATTDTSSPSAIDGPYNRNALRFSVFASDNLAFSDFLFEKFGNTSDSTDDGSYTTVYNIDTEVRVVGAKTGYSLSIPLRFVKIKSF
jgi:hypothetical protein